MASLSAEMTERFLIALGIALPMIVWVIAVVHWLIDGLIEIAHGAAAILLALCLMAIAIWVPVAEVRVAIFVSVLATLAVFPFAYSQYARLQFLEVDEDDLARAHEAFALNPGNAAARFEIARLLWLYGLRGQAITIAEVAAGALPDVRDEILNRSVKDLFHAEIRKLESWKREADKAKDFHPAECVRCKARNPLDAIACVRCGAPYLLDLARKRTVKSKLVGKLVVTWIIAATVFAIVPYLALRLGFGIALAIVCAFLIAAIGAVAYFFRERSLAK